MYWTVYPGDGSGSFSREFAWHVPKFDLTSGGDGFYYEEDATGASTKHLRTSVAAALHDVSGDGLPDLVVQEAQNGPLIAFINTGRSFADEAIPLGSVGPIEQTQTDVVLDDLDRTGLLLLEGNHGYRRRMLDVDEDGILDLVEFPGPTDDITRTDTPQVSFGLGDRFLPAQSAALFGNNAASSFSLAKRLFWAAKTDDGYRWWVGADLTDVTGDGLADLVAWGQGGATLVITDNPSAGPLRLLQRVDNGRGGIIEFSYAPSTEDTAVTMKEPPIVPGRTHLPQTRWVVTAVSVDPGFGNERMKTLYTYANPVYGSPPGRNTDPKRFLGFGRVRIDESAPAGSAVGKRTERLYTYAIEGTGDGKIPLDARGHVAEEWIFGYGGGDYELSSHRKVDWVNRPLFDGMVAFTHRTSTITRTCPPGVRTRETTACTDVKREVEQWEAQGYPSSTTCVPTLPTTRESVCTFSGPTVLYLRTLTQDGSGPTEGAGDRLSLTRYQVRYGQEPFDPTDYRVLPTLEETNEAMLVNSLLSWDTWSRSETVYNAAGLPEQSIRWMDDATPATTKQTFDAAGNVFTVTKPEQTLGSQARTTYRYDINRLFVAATTNELAHTVYSVYDLGTGAQLERKGPNRVITPCGTSLCVYWEREGWKVDGFGRVVQRSVGIGKFYSPTVVWRTIFEDSALPNRVTTEELRDFGGAVWVRSVTEIDGIGRVLREIEPVDGKPPAVTQYSYDAAGELSAKRVPDPTTDTGATVQYAFEYDALGRVIQFRRPDGSTVKVDYVGLQKTVYDVTTDGSGKRTTYASDVFGRLVEVREHLNQDSEAITRYTYDANDNLKKVVNAEENVTDLHHDWTGNRLEIKRGNRIWKYHYNRNGKLDWVIAPMPTGAVETDYATTYKYDDLDRLALRTPAKRGLSTPDADARGIGPVRYFYDWGTNGVGRLTLVEGRRSDGGIAHHYEVSYGYEARGLVSFERRTFRTIYPARGGDTQWVSRSYNALGLPTQSTWKDGQTWRRTYDGRGLVASLEWYDGTAWRKVAAYNRSCAGAPRSRASDYNQTRSWTYDTMGRPLTDTISASISGPFGPFPVIRSFRKYVYNQDSSLRDLTGSTGGLTALGRYSYDALGRITHAQGSDGYLAEFSYSATGNVLTATVTGAGSTPTRAVSYHYGNRDPQAVDRIENLSDGSAFGAFTYDPSGNMTARKIPSEGPLDLTWDGEDRLREVNGPGGREVYLYDHNATRIAAVNETDGVRFWFAEAEFHYRPLSDQTTSPLLDHDAGDGFHYDPINTPARIYLHLSDGAFPVARITDRSTLELQYSDALRNLVLSLDKNGAVVAAFSYGPFGEVLKSIGGDDHRRQFNGKENDALTSLRYYGFRYYDPLVLRWLNSDPLYRFLPEVRLAEPQRMNLYAFSLNDPLRYTDPDGRNPFEAARHIYEALTELNHAVNTVLETVDETMVSGGTINHREIIALAEMRRGQIAEETAFYSTNLIAPLIFHRAPAAGVRRMGIQRLPALRWELKHWKVNLGTARALEKVSSGSAANLFMRNLGTNSGYSSIAPQYLDALYVSDTVEALEAVIGAIEELIKIDEEFRKIEEYLKKASKPIHLGIPYQDDSAEFQRILDQSRDARHNVP